MVTNEVIKVVGNKFALTHRQQEVLALVVQDEESDARTIADRLGCSMATIYVHLSNIFSKMGCRNKAAVIKAVLKMAPQVSLLMPITDRPLTILSAVDHTLHQLLSRVVSEHFAGRVTLISCSPNQEVLMHLARVKMQDPDFPRPDMILLDVHQETETLRRIKSDPTHEGIPVVTFAETLAERDAIYALGANSLVQRPQAIESLERTLHLILQYWTL